ncbi:MAG: hypothetical protein Q8914_05580 [Bacteroidota bacterium]|nr:hypothetical protein [Bacteroidota bacterium]
MIKKIHALIMICFCLLVAGCSSTDRQHVIVHGALKHLGCSELHLNYFDKDHNICNDTIFSTGSGKFEFKIDATEEVSPITIYFQDFKCWTTLFAQAGDDIQISGDIELVDLLTIKGGIVNNDLTRFKQDIKPLYVERQEIINGKYQNGGESIEVRLAEIDLALKRKAKQFIAENPFSVASVVLIQDFFYQDYDPTTSELIELLKGDAQKSHLTAKLKEGMASW